MSTSKATPGPWEARKNHTTWIILGGDDWSVCSFYSDTERADADARLIAAAPELRDALIARVELDEESARFMLDGGHIESEEGCRLLAREAMLRESARALIARLDAEDK